MKKCLFVFIFALICLFCGYVVNAGLIFPSSVNYGHDDIECTASVSLKKGSD